MYKCECGREFKNSQGINGHKQHCEIYVKKEKNISKYKIEENLYKCECGREFKKSQSLNAHFCQCSIHRNGKPIINKWNGKNGKNNWIKGLTKETDERVLKVSKTLHKKYNSGEIIPYWKNKHHSEKTLNKLSLARIKYLENNPHVKWYIVNNGQKDIKVQGKWEKDVAEWLTKQNIKWDRITLKYDKTHRYTPDFYLIELNEYLEVKGWLRDIDKIKMNKIIKQHNIKIKIMFQNDYRHLNDININSLKYFK